MLRNLTRGDEVTVVNRVKGSTHYPDSTPGRAHRHEIGLVVGAVVVVTARVSVDDVAIREHNDREKDKSEDEDAGPHEGREEEGCKLFRCANDGVHENLLRIEYFKTTFATGRFLAQSTLCSSARAVPSVRGRAISG